MLIKKKLSEAAKARKRVLIAKDVLYRLRTKKIESQFGIYFNVNDSLVPGKDMQKTLKQPAVVCKVCAVGAAFVSGIFKFDNYNVPARLIAGDSRLTRKQMTRFLYQFFSADQLNLIETAFEGFAPSVDHVAAAFIAFQRYNTAELKLRAIFTNIIRNKGTFKIPAKFLKEAKHAN